MKILNKLTVFIFSSALFIGCASMGHNHHGKMSMKDMSCCCKSGSESGSCSMHGKHGHDSKAGMPMNHKDKKKNMMCGNKNQNGCSMMGMKGKSDKGKIFEKLDENSDGKISISEFLKMPNNKFDSLDSNNDGFISKEEMNAKKSNHHSHH